jgi:hypothetical protein
MITVKEAVKNATLFFAEVFPNATDVRLEEVELSDEGPWWNVTLSFPGPSPTSAIASVLGGQQGRIYKLVKIDAESGEPKGILIRKL